MSTANDQATNTLAIPASTQETGGTTIGAIKAIRTPICRTQTSFLEKRSGRGAVSHGQIRPAPTK